MADLDVIVINHRTPGDLASFLRSLEFHAGAVTVKVWIGNVAPRFEDVRVAEEWRDTTTLDADHIVFDDNIGFARACNDLVARGSANYVALFNADVELTDGAIDACYGALAAREDWATLGPRQVNEKNQITHAGIFGGEARPAHRGWRSTGNLFRDIRDDAVFVSGSAVFVRRSVWDFLAACPIVTEAFPAVDGAMPPFALLYYEDSWLGVHARSHGFLNAYFGEVTVIHKWHQSVKANGQPDSVVEDAHDRFRALCEAHSIPHD